MRTSLAAFSALALTAIALTGCTPAPSFDGESCDRASSSGLADAVEVTGELGAPQVAVAAPLRTEGSAYADLIVGDGRTISAENQSAIISLAFVNGETGTVLGAPTITLMDSVEAAKTPNLETALRCATEGSRVVFSLPTNDLDGAAAQLGMGEDENVIMVADILSVPLAKAEGTNVFNTQRGLPSIVRAPDGRPGIIVPDSAAPTELVTETLIAGDGPVVGDSTPLYHFTSLAWDTRQVITTTWDAPASVGVDGLPDAVAEAIQGATVGSQVLIVIPGQDDLSAEVYVVDVLGTVPAELEG